MTDNNIWYVYILKCRDKSLYTGVTIDLERRVNEHNDGKLGARYTRSRRPVKLVYFEEASCRSDACKREWKIKQLDKKKKLNLVTSFQKASKLD